MFGASSKCVAYSPRHQRFAIHTRPSVDKVAIHSVILIVVIIISIVIISSVASRVVNFVDADASIDATVIAIAILLVVVVVVFIIIVIVIFVTAAIVGTVVNALFREAALALFRTHTAHNDVFASYNVFSDAATHICFCVRVASTGFVVIVRLLIQHAFEAVVLHCTAI
jgi:hypothetical protein